MSKSVRHANRAIQRGFTQVPNVVLLDPDLSVGAKYTYALFEHFAWADEKEWPGQDELAKRMKISIRSLSNYIGELKAGSEACGILLETQRRGQGKSNAYVVHDPDPDRQILPIKTGNDCRSGSADIAEPNSEGEDKASDEAANAASSSAGNTPRAGGEVVKFRGRQVPLDVYCTSVALLDTFNRLAGTGYQALTGHGRATEGLKRIFGAILDQPAISLDIGERMIRIQLADPYWQGKPQPGNVFGPGVAERNFEAATWTAEKGGSRPSAARGFVDRLDAKRTAA